MSVDPLIEPPRADPPTVEEAKLSLQLIRLDEKFSRATNQATFAMLERERGARLGLPDLAILDWVETYSEELAYVRSARNAIAHAQPIDGITLEKAVDLAKALDEALLVRVD